MPKGSSPYFLNVLKGEDGSVGELTNLKGNRKVTYPLGDSNAYFVLSSCYDGLTRNVYYFIFSQPFDTTGSGDYEYDNRLVRFNEDSEQIDTIFYDNKNYFGLDPTRLFKDAFVLGDWLYFNPIESEPKMIHIEMALNYTKALKGLENHSFYDDTLTYLYGDKVAYFGGIFVANTSVAVGENPVSNYAKWDRIGDCYQDISDIGFDSEFRYAFNVIKHIPVYRPSCVYASDPDKNANNVRAKLFRFSHRYKYFDNSFSRYSAFSDITLPQYDEYYNGEVPGDLDQFNCIDVSIPLHSAALIKEIDIIFQETGGDWKRAKIINRRDISILNGLTYTYRFYNTDSAYEVIDDTAFNEAYDSVPKKANAQEIINKNILCYGGCTEGFTDLDKNDIDVILTPEIEAIGIPNSKAVIRDNTYENGDIESFLYTYSTYINIYFEPWYAGAGVVAGDIYIIKIDGKTATYTIQPADVASISAFTSAIRDFLTASFPTLVFYGVDFAVKGYGVQIVFTEAINLSISTFYHPSGSSEASLVKATGFKTGAWHPFCIFYYDKAMRRWDAQTSKDSQDGVVAWSADGTTVYVPMLGEYSPTPATTANKWNINWEVNHLPPEGARWWRWGYAGNALASSFRQYIVETIEDESPLTKLDITPLQTLKTNTVEATWNIFPQSIIEPYSWTKGDRVRVITQAASAGDMGAVIDGVYDFEIIKYDDTVTDQYWIYTQDFDFTAIGAGVQSLVEIYTPIKSDTARIFFEFGELMPIIEDSDGVWVHGAGTTGLQNQDTLLADPATGVFTAGDVYHILRTPSMPISTVNGYFHESQWYSDFYDSDDWDKGRIGVETQFGERKLNIVRHSNQYLQNTMINGLPTFHGGDYKELNDVFGDIMRIIEIGDTLKVYQRKKPSSILIGRTEYIDAAGNSNIVQISDRVFGSIRYSSTNYGTEFAESIERNNRYVYGFDVYNGVLWRDSPNGIFPVSGRYESADGGGDYKMETYFKQKSKDLLVSGIAGIDVMTVWDERHKNLYVIFKDAVNEENDEAIIFHEPSNRWICYTNMDQTPAEGWNQILELDWYILWGFDAGLGIYFNEDTRFVEFDLSTHVNGRIFPEKLDLTFTAYAPTTTSTCDSAQPKVDMIMTPYVPTIVISNVDISVLSMTWTALQYGVANRTGTPFGCSPSPAVISSIVAYPSKWFEITDVNGVILSQGSNVTGTLGSMLYIYPYDANTGDWGNRTATITITGTYGDSDTITLIQSAPLIPATVEVRNAGDDTSGMVLTNTSGQHTYGNRTISIALTADHPAYATGETFRVRWNATISRNNEQFDAGIGYFWATDNTFMGAVPITLTMDAITDDVIYVWLKADTATNTDVTGSLLTMTMTPYTPSVIIQEASASVTLFNFDATEDTYAEAVANGHQTTISAKSDTDQARLISIPAWLTVWHGDDMTGYALYVGDTILDGETITLFPKLANTELVPVPAVGNDYVVIGDSYDGSVTVTLTVNQDASVVIPPGQVPLPAGVSSVHSSSSSYLTIIDNAYSIYGLSLSTFINYSFKGVKNSLLNFGDAFDLYYRLDITRAGITFTDSTGVISGVQNSQDSDNFYTFAGYLDLTYSTLENDVVTLYLSIYSF